MADLDLSKLSDDDLLALKSGDLSKVSDQGLLTLKGQSMPSAAEQIANDPITKGAQDVLSTTPAELAAANPAVRAGLGAISPVMGAAQLAAEALGSKSITEYLKNLEGMKQRGIAALSESPSGQVANAVGTGAEIGGNLLSFAPAGKIAPAAGALGKIAQGAEIGSLAGLTAPVTSEDYWNSKGGQILLGTLVGGAIPGAMEAGRSGFAGARNIMDMFTQEGANRILTRYMKQIVGEKNLDKVIESLKGVKEEIPGYQGTVAETLSGVPEASPLVAHQKITATTPGGVSAKFGQRNQEQLAAMQAFRDRIEAEAAPVREAALDAANQGGVRINGIEDTIDNILKTPGQRASTVVKKSMEALKAKLSDITNQSGIADSRDLYTVRKEIGSIIQTFGKENSNWDKRMTAGIERSVQQSIDNAIESAGGTGWKTYLNDYASKMSKLDEKIAEREKMYKPDQKTNLQGGDNVAGQMQVRGPQMLSRPMMVTNFILKKMGENIEKKIDPEAADRYLNPEKLAAELSKFSPEMKKSIVQDLIRMGRLPAVGGISAESVGTYSAPPPTQKKYQPGMTGVRG